MIRPFVLALVLVHLLAVPVFAQVLPNHVDPSARTDAPNPASVPAIRFLTTADFPPFNYSDSSGRLVGFNVDLARAICAEVKATCTIQPWPWDQIADALADNQGDAIIAGLAINSANGARFDFSRVYLQFPARFVMLKSRSGQLDPERLEGKAIAVRKGSAHEEFARRYLSGADILEFDNELDALDAVRQEKAFAYFGDAMRASFWLNEHADCCGFSGPAYFRPDLFGRGMAIATQAGLQNLTRAIDAALVRLKRDGTLDQLYLRWFPVSFY
ncbi:MAG TPA: transporter substrate-binding domain-containing protein [Devosiaceae bacterium]